MPRHVTLEADYLAARHMIRTGSSMLAGLLIILLSTLIAAGIGWAGWAEVDEVVTAQGRVEPAGKAKLINHPTGGRITHVHVADGSYVRMGEPLFTLDAEMSMQEREELLGRWQVHAFEVLRLRAEVEMRELDPNTTLARQRSDLFVAQRELMQARLEALKTNRLSLEKQIETRNEDVRSMQAEVQRINNGLELLNEQLDAVNELYKRGLYPRLKLVALEREVSDARGERSKAVAGLAGARAALAEAESRKRSIEKEWRRDGLADLGRATAERDRLWEKLQAHDALLDGLVVTAPVDGIIQEVAITGEGQSIAANLPVMKLVPVGREMVVQADVSNDDISKIETGMPAAIKIRAYDFIRFGTFDGTVQQINRDSHQNQDGTGYNYRVRIATDLAKVKPELDILPGMLVSVELKVGSRTILSYMTDRIIEWREQAFTDS